MKQTTLLLMLVLMTSVANSQVITTLPHVIEGVEYDYLPHNDIDHLPYQLGSLDADSLFNELYYNALVLAGLAESAYFQNEEWQHECRLDKQRVNDFFLIMAPLRDTVLAQWNALRDIQTEPAAVNWFATVDPFAQSSLLDVEEAIDQYLFFLNLPDEECDQHTPVLDGRISNMVRARYFYEQVLLTVAPYYNRNPKNPLR